MKHPAISIFLAVVLTGLAGAATAADPATPGLQPVPQPAPQAMPGPGPGAGMGRGMGPGMGPGMPTFGDFDLNGDGTLTEDEFNQARAKRMADRAAQGYPMRNAARAPNYKDFDTDHDGKMTADEFNAGMAEHHRQMMAPR